ncbi:MAG: hypothetical protein WA160_08500 [Pseudobdellovibrio sp.]
MIGVRIVKLAMIFLIIFGFSPKSHLPKDISLSPFQFKSLEFKSSILADYSVPNSPSNALGLHACHLGHGGCFFKAPTEYSCFSIIGLHQNFIYPLESNYMNPDLKKIDRPPIS